jgi:hypothetical protein
LDPAAWDLLRIHNHAVARVAAARPPTGPGAGGGAAAGLEGRRQWRDAASLARVLSLLRMLVRT